MIPTIDATPSSARHQAARDYRDSIAENRRCPGILLFSSSGRVLWAERRAWELCRALKDRSDSAQGAIPRSVKAICAKVLGLLKDHGRERTIEHFRVRQLVKGSGLNLLVCGYGLPSASMSGCRILVLIEQIGRRGEAAAEQAKELYRLTRREVEVVNNLLKGWSNKEIANELKLTEQTVKEHLQRIMAKTRTTSRTGILARVLCV
jgi:DNA-binding CsgD family transcriptional regulator